MTKPKLAISFSGGRTSALMAKLCLEQFSESHEIIVTFANTGLEHPATLEFVHKCDTEFKFPTVWLEAVVGPPRVGIRSKVVDYRSASRNGEPFEAYIAKYGIPNRELPQCTSRLKGEVMAHYLATRGFTRTRYSATYDTAIGIRADEIDRISARAKEYRFIYPLVKAGITKGMVIAFWRNQSFDLQLPGEHYGNCVTCWKKSFRKLATIANEAPESFDFFRRMEAQYGHVKALNGNRRFFRLSKSVDDVFAIGKEGGFAPYSDAVPPGPELGVFDTTLDIGSGCSESCEIGADS